MNAKVLVRVVSHREANRPVNWIAREESLASKDVRAILRIAGDPWWNATEISLEKYDRMEYFVKQEAPQSEIMKTVKVDNRTVQRWFPGAGFKRGTKGHLTAGRMAAQMKELERGKR